MACTHSSVGRDIELGTLGLLLARAAPGVILVQPLISLSFSMDSILFSAQYDVHKPSDKKST